VLSTNVVTSGALSAIAVAVFVMVPGADSSTSTTMSKETALICPGCTVPTLHVTIPAFSEQNAADCA